MKVQSMMRILILGALPFGAAVAQQTTGYQGTGPQQTTQPTGVAPAGTQQDSTGAPGDTGQRMQDKLFVKTAAQGALAQVKLNQLALAKSDNDDVKTFAQKMLTDHAALARAWRPLVNSLGITNVREPSKKQQKVYEKLSGLSGAEFDKAYIAAMVEDHHEDLKLFKDASVATADPTIKEAAEQGLPVIQEHSALADELARKSGVVASK